MRILILSLIFITSFNTVAQLSWLPISSAPKSYRLDDFYFITPQKGWAINPYYNYLSPNKFAQIYKTNDGGINWQIVKDSSTTYFRSIGFADSLTGWVGNLADSSITPDTIPFYNTHDGGFTWSPVTNIPNPKPKGICGISIVTDSVIYAYGRYYGPAVLIKTVDKGNTWTSQDMSAYASGLVDAHFFDKDTGFVTGCYGSTPSGQQKALILSTFDGGTTWQIRHQSIRNNEEVWKIVFPSRKIGYATIEFQGSFLSTIDTYFLKTTDGGITWNELPFLAPSNYYDLQGIGFINDTIGWIGGDCVKPTYKTMDGGITWNTDISLGVRSSFDLCSDTLGITMNRFRNFGDTLMYGSGYTVCKLSKSITGIKKISQSNLFEVYPNPTSDQFFIDANTTDKLTVDLYDVNGRHVFSKSVSNKSNIDVTTLRNGIYTLTIKSVEGVTNKKLIILR